MWRMTWQALCVRPYLPASLDAAAPLPKVAERPLTQPAPFNLQSEVGAPQAQTRLTQGLTQRLTPG
jgi:hypothetical protein